jgi:hypothetical protein
MMYRTKSRLTPFIVGAALLLMVLIQLLPFYVAVTTAFKPMTDLSSQLLPPTSLYLGNYTTARGWQYPAGDLQQRPDHVSVDRSRLLPGRAGRVPARAKDQSPEQDRTTPDH